MTQAAATMEPIDSLTPWSRNPRHNAEAVDAVAASIRRFGFASPIIARAADRVIIAGHTRWKAARVLGMLDVPVRLLDLTEAEAHALALADNRLGEIATWDDAELSRILRDLAADDVSIGDLGWDEAELAAMLEPAAPDVPPPDEAPPVQDEAVSRTGEVYELGPHRLICGDSTDGATWAALLGSDRPTCMWTDPPYGVSYVGKTKDAMEIANDKLDNDGLDTFLSAVWVAALGACEAGAAWYVAAPAGPRGVPFATTLLAASAFRQRLVWVKSCMVLGYSDYHYRHEDIYFGYTPGPGKRGRGGDGWYGDNAQTTVLEFDKPSRNGEHPTMKPIALVAHCLRNSARPGDVVVDPFGGSGSTMMACASLAMRARLIELDPRYCDVIRKRWTMYADEHGLEPGSGALR